MEWMGEDRWWQVKFGLGNGLVSLGNKSLSEPVLTHWDWVTHICVGNLTIIGSDNGLSPGRRQAIIWTNVGILLIGPLGTNFSEMLIEIHTFSFKKIHLKTSSAKWRLFCLGLNELTKISQAAWRRHVASRPDQHWFRSLPLAPSHYLD